MAKANHLDVTIFGRVLAGALLGAAVGGILLLWVIPGASSYRPAVWSTIVVPLGCFLGWLFAPSRERPPVAVLACLGLYFLSAFAAARLSAWTGWNYFHTIVPLQTLAGIGLAVGLGFIGRSLPKVERLQDARDIAGLAELLSRGAPLERLEAARALGALGTESGRAALLAALEDNEALVAREAAGALVGLAGAADTPQLEKALRHPDPLVRRRALRALRWIDGPGARQLVATYRRRTG